MIVPRFSEFQLPSWNATLGVDLPNPVGSMVDEPPPKADTPDEDSVSIESVTADADRQMIRAMAVQAVLTETGLWELPSGDTPISAAQNTTDEAVASTEGGAYFWNEMPPLMATSKMAPRPRPSVNPARVVVATTSSSSSASAAWTSSMVSDLVRANEQIDTAASGVDVAGSYQRVVEAFMPANPEDTEQHESDADCE